MTTSCQPMAPAALRKRRSRFLRFSLRTLLLFALLIGATGTVIHNWGPPWVRELRLDRAKLFRGNSLALVHEKAEGGTRLALWDLAQARKLFTIPFGVKFVPMISANEQCMVVLSDTDEWHAYDLKRAAPIGKLSKILRVDALSPDGGRALGLNQYYQFAEFDVSTGRQLYTFEFPKPVRAARYLNGQVLVSLGKGEYQFAEQGKPMPFAKALEKPADSAAPQDQSNTNEMDATLSFPDGRVLKVEQLRLTILDPKGEVLWERDTDFKKLVRLPVGNPPVQNAAKLLGGGPSSSESISFHYAILDGGRRMVMGSELLYTDVYRNVRPEPWWGVAWIPEGWVAGALLILFVWSLVRDWRVKV